MTCVNSLYSFFEAINIHKLIRLNQQQLHTISAALPREDAIGMNVVFNTLFVLLTSLSFIAVIQALNAIIISPSIIDIIISLLIILSILISGILILNLIIR